MVMPISHMPDWDRRLARQDSFWSREIIDRPVVHITCPKAAAVRDFPRSRHATTRDRWMDVEYQTEMALAQVANTEYLGDALPHVYPNLGPEVFAAFFGCELDFGEETSWSKPCLRDWPDADKLQFSTDNVYWQTIFEMTEALLAAGKDVFYTGITDLHPGADALAAFRDPRRLNIDMIEAPKQVKHLLDRVTEIYLQVYDFFYDKLLAEGQPISTWADIVSTKKWLVPSNDFSCMVSPRMFQDVFLPSIVAECRHYEASLYHLDGPDALKHLDALLKIPELTAVQWVCGAGKGRASDWLDVYRRCQQAGKGIQVFLEPDEIELFTEAVRPEGVWLRVDGVPDREHGEAIIQRLSEWR